MRIYIDGQLYAEEDAKVSVLGRAFLQGLGLRTRFGCRDGRFFRLDEQLKEMQVSATELDLEFPWELNDIKEALAVTYEMNGLTGTDAEMELLLCMGTKVDATPAKTDESPKPEKKRPGKDEESLAIAPSLMVLTRARSVFSEKPLEGIALASLKKFPFGDKLLLWERRYLGNLGTQLARKQAQEAGAQEAVISNHDGFAMACTGGELFPVLDGCVWVPESLQSGVVVRFIQGVFNDMGIKNKVQPIKMRELPAVEECFLMTEVGEVIPVLTIDGQTIGGGKPGSLTQTIAVDLQSTLRADSQAIFHS